MDIVVAIGISEEGGHHIPGSHSLCYEDLPSIFGKVPKEKRPKIYGLIAVGGVDPTSPYYKIELASFKETDKRIIELYKKIAESVRKKSRRYLTKQKSDYLREYKRKCEILHRQRRSSLLSKILE